MQFLRHAPGPPLDEFVEYFWLCTQGQSNRKERILPSGTVELVINLCQDEVRIHNPSQPHLYKRLSGAVIAGTYSRVFVVDAMQQESMLGVHFRPGGAFPFLGAMTSEVLDRHVNLADLWGASALALRERLVELTTPRERFEVMEEILIERLARCPKRHLAVPATLDVLGAGTGASVRDLAREVGLCHRRFIQVFTAQVGLTPKLFCRLLRFQRVRNLLEIRTPDWAQLALTCGYFDQSHLINDFQEFSGSSPTEYLRQRQHSDRLLANHVTLSR